MIVKLEDVYNELQKEDIKNLIALAAKDVSNNISDPTTHPTNKRGIQIVLVFSPNTERSEVQTDIDIKIKSAPRFAIPRSLAVATTQPPLENPSDPNQPTFSDVIEEDDEEETEEEEED